MSTYSPDLRIELITTGDQAGTWGTTTNTNLGTIIEDAISGYVTVSVLATNQAFSAINGAADEARNAMIRLTTTTGAPFNVYAPPSSKQYIIWNNSGQPATIYNSTVIGNTTAAGAGVTIANGDRVVVFSNGTNFYDVKSGNVTGTVAIANGGTGQTTANAAFNALVPNQSGQAGKYLKSDGTNTAWDALDISTADISGTLAVANGGTGATTAANARTNLGLGSIATQNANGVSITGGSITGITDLAVADGGTGASDAAGARTNLGLGSIATQNANNVNITGGAVTATSGSLTNLSAMSTTNATITGGSITGITDLAIADGGTGASDAATARSNLGLGSMATQNANSVAITGGSITLTTALPIASGGTGGTSIATARSNLGLGTIVTQNANSVDISGGAIYNTSIRIPNATSPAPTLVGDMVWGITPNTIVVGNGTSSISMATTTTSQTLTNKTLGSGSTWNGNAVPVTHGGTGATSASVARTNLGVPATDGTGATGNWTGITVSSFIGSTEGVFSFGNSNSVNVGFGNSTNGLPLWVNRQSSLGFANEFRNFIVGDGKGAVVAEFTGSTKALNVVGTITQNGSSIAAIALAAVYPVGSIYINATNSTNPATLLGFGTWVAFGAGRVPVGFNASDPLFDTAEETGGSKDAVVVSHTHSFSATTSTAILTGTITNQYVAGDTYGTSTGVFSQTNYVVDGDGGEGRPGRDIAFDGSHSHTVSGTTGSTGVSGTNANLQPYITVYMWKRTA